MTLRSISALLSLLAHIIVFIWQYYILLQGISPSLAVESQIALWGSFFLRSLVIVVAVQIVLSILFHIIVQMMVREDMNLQDERDQKFELRSLRNFMMAFTLGFYIAMAFLAFGYPLPYMFHTFAFTYLLAGIVNYLSFVFYYERGY